MIKNIFWFFLISVISSYAQVSNLSKPENLVKVSHLSGYYNSKISVTFSGNASGFYYTIDGSIPTKASPKYSKAIVIDTVTVLRIKPEVTGNLVDTLTYTFTYLINFKSVFPIVSLVTDDENLWGATGIIKNFRKKEEKPCHFDFFETDGTCVISQDCGIKLFGGKTREFSEKSMQLVARKQYSDSRFHYQFFKDKDIKKYKWLVLRTSGNDFRETRFLDAMTTGLVKNLDLMVQGYRPTVLFINGKYWGIYNLREKINDEYLKNNAGANPDSCDLLFRTGGAEVGRAKDYHRMLEFMKNNSPSIQKNYDSIKKLMDVDNFINYMCSQLYICNQDKGNIRWWRAKNLDNKWRWIFYDTDAGFGASFQAYDNWLHVHLMPRDNRWFNQPWSTFLFRTLMESNEFRTKLINQSAHLLNTNFQEDTVYNHIAYFEALLSPEIDRHLNRWDREKKDWCRSINRLEKFASIRPKYFRQQMIEELGLKGLFTLYVNYNDTVDCQVKISGNKLKTRNFKGVYYKDISLPLKAKAGRLYQFDHWEISDKKSLLGDEKNDKIEIKTMLESVSVTPVFRFRDWSEKKNELIITEICFKNNKKTTGDWIELYNTTDEEIDLTDWILATEKDEFVFLKGTILKAESFLVLANDSLKFSKYFKDSVKVFRTLPFNFKKKKEKFYIFDKEGKKVFVSEYHAKKLGIKDNDTLTFSLIFNHLSEELEDEESVKVIQGNGTPGKLNHEEQSVEFKNDFQFEWMWVVIPAGIFLIWFLFEIWRRTRRKKHRPISKVKY